MRFLVDHCAGRRVAEWLDAQGHDVVDAGALESDPIRAIRSCSNARPPRAEC